MGSPQEEKRAQKEEEEEEAALRMKVGLSIPLLPEEEEDRRLAALLKYHSPDCGSWGGLGGWGGGGEMWDCERDARMGCEAGRSPAMWGWGGDAGGVWGQMGSWVGWGGYGAGGGPGMWG